MVCTTDRFHYGFKSCEANDPKQTSAIESGIRIESKELLANTLIVVSKMLQEQI